MGWKRYKAGDRIFYENPHDNSIETAIVLKTEDCSYVSDKGKTIPYQWLYTSEFMGIENYNCISANNSEIKEMVEDFRKFDKRKKKVVSSILKLMKDFSPLQVKEIVKQLIIETKYDD